MSNERPNLVRIGKTEDDSDVYEMAHPDVVVLDVYPDGDAILLVRKGEWRELFELGPISQNVKSHVRERDLRPALEELLSAVTSKGTPDSRLPIMWSGSSDQNRRMYAAIEAARKVLKP